MSLILCALLSSARTEPASALTAALLQDQQHLSLDEELGPMDEDLSEISEVIDEPDQVPSDEFTSSEVSGTELRDADADADLSESD